MAQAWLVRAGRDDEYEREAFDEGVVALGWRRVGDLSEHRTIGAITSAVNSAYAEFTARSRTEFGVQLFAFRGRMRVGDYVVLVRANAPDLAIGVVSGDYSFRRDLPGPHVRPVRWERIDVRRTEVGADFLAFPALTNIYKVNKPDADLRLAKLVASSTISPVEPIAAPSEPVSIALAGPLDNLRNNLDYAMNLATAGHYLQQLQVALFEVSDIYRAAWVQAVAALDHWVHQEIHVRMLALAETAPGRRPKKFQDFTLPLALVSQIAAGKLSVRDAVDQHFDKAFGRQTFQQPRAIVAGLAHVADTTDLWKRVAALIADRSGGEENLTAAEIEQRLQSIVFRRNRIAHSYDEDPQNPPSKQDIDTAATTKAVRFIGELAEAVVAVLETRA